MSDGERCILCTVYLVNVRAECPFSFVCVLLQEESVVIVVDGGIFPSRCLTVDLPCSIEGPECHREPLVPVGFSCVGAAQFGGTKFLTLWMRD